MKTPCLAAGRWFALALAAAGAGTTPFPGSAAELSGGQIVDEVVAVVGTRGREARVITLTKVTEEGRIALVSRGGSRLRSPGSTGRCSGPPSTGTSTSCSCSTRRSVSRSSRWTRPRRRPSWCASRPSSPIPKNYGAFLREIDVGEEELLASLRRSVRVRRYLESRLGRLRATPGEVAAWYAAHAAEFGGRSLAEVSDEITARLSAARADAETKTLLSDLRGRADIRVLVDLGKRP